MRHLPLILIVLLVIATALLLVTADGSDDDGRADARPGIRYTLFDDGPAPEAPARVAVEHVAPAEASTVAVEARPSRTVDPETKIAEYAVADATVAEAVDEVAERLGCRATFTDAAWELVGPSSSVHLHLADVSARTVLDMVTAMHGLRWKLVDGTLWILTEGEEPPEAAR